MMPRNHLLKTNYVFPHEWLILDANKKRKSYSCLASINFIKSEPIGNLLAKGADYKDLERRCNLI